MKLLSRIPLLLLLLGLPFQEVPADGPIVQANDDQSALAEIQVTAAKTKVQVAEPFEVQLTVVAREGVRVTLPPIDKQLGDFDVIEQQETSDLPLEDGMRLWQRTIILESIQTGNLTIPSLEVRVKSAEQEQVLRSPTVAVVVASVLEDRADPTQIRDIRPVIDLPVPQQKDSLPQWPWWVGGGGLAAMFGLAIVLLARRRRPQWLSPAAWAQGELSLLATSTALPQSDPQTATNQLAMILRQYLQLQFEVDAPTMTTNELLATIADREQVSQEQLQSFRELLSATDLARFAGMSMTEEELKAAIEQASELVSQTGQQIAGLEHRSEHA